MKFKQITYSADPKVIGINNGVYQLEIKDRDLKCNKNYEEIERVLILSHISKFLENQSKIKELEIKYLKGTLLKKANLTDIMVFSPSFLGYKYIVSHKFVDCIKEEDIIKEEYHLRKIDIEGVDMDYYLFFVPMIPASEVDFTESLIYLEREFLLEKKNYLNINSYDEYQRFLDNNPFIAFERICLNKEHSSKSIICIQGVVELFFSESLIARMQAANITNLEVSNRQVELCFS